MSDLAGFLLARIAEDEMVASPFRNDFGRAKQWRCDEVGGKVREVGPTEFGLPDVIAEADIHFAAEHIARHDPARVLAECAAKRLMVARLDDYGMGISDGAALSLMGYMALPYATHPDYDPEWRP